MTYREIEQMISRTGLEHTYYQWDAGHAPELPYILFYYPERNDFIADGRNYLKITKVNIELYSENKDFENESVIEDLLDEYGLVYETEEQYISDERMYERLYTMEVNLDE